MVKLYKFVKKLGNWVFFDYGVSAKTDEYLRQGLVVWLY